VRLAYFDENKYSEENPFFVIGGIIIPGDNVIDLENTLSQIQYNFFGNTFLTRDTEFHGKELFHGKAQFKGRNLSERVQLFRDIATFILNNKIPIRMVRIDVHRHREKYAYPAPEYRLGLMLILERICDFLDSVDDMGLVFADYEKDELTNSVLDFSQFKMQGKTPMYFGRPLGRLIDTVYFTHSHHSRFLQVADILVFLAGRYENMEAAPSKWHDNEVLQCWENIRANADIKIQRWP